MGTGSRDGASELSQISIRSKVSFGTHCKTEQSFGRASEECVTDWSVHGTCGGSAGDGGKGGIEGRPGFVRIIELADKSSIKTSAEKGAVGDSGTGGSNGRNPSAINMRYSVSYQYGITDVVRGKWKEVSRQGDLTCTAIRDSVNGNNGYGIRNPEPLAFDSGDVLKKFQAFVHVNQIDRIKRDDLAELEKKMEKIQPDSILMGFDEVGIMEIVTHNPIKPDQFSRDSVDAFTHTPFV